jgi:hypothetical protein
MKENDVTDKGAMWNNKIDRKNKGFVWEMEGFCVDTHAARGSVGI